MSASSGTYLEDLSKRCTCSRDTLGQGQQFCLLEAKGVPVTASREPPFAPARSAPEAPLAGPRPRPAAWAPSGLELNARRSDHAEKTSCRRPRIDRELLSSRKLACLATGLRGKALGATSLAWPEGRRPLRALGTLWALGTSGTSRALGSLRAGRLLALGASALSSLSALGLGLGAFWALGLLGSLRLPSALGAGRGPWRPRRR